MQINARCEADVTPAQIMKRAQEGSGSKYSTHKEDYKPERINQLQPAYQRTVIPDIAAMKRSPIKPEPAPKVLSLIAVLQPSSRVEAIGSKSRTLFIYVIILFF